MPAKSATPPKSSGYLPKRIVSGGQTGVDRAALEFAIAMGIEHGGWCPKGRLSEDGTIPSRYHLTENDSVDYKVRTEQNVVDSDATLILYVDRLGGGTLLTRRMAAKHHKPCLCLDIARASAGEIALWLAEVRPICLNIAGPRESLNPGIEMAALEFLMGTP